MLLECKSCGRLIFFGYDDLSYGCPNCESKFIGKYEGIIGMYHRLNLENETQK